MANYRDAAVADNAARHQAWVNRGREKVRPLLTDSTGKMYLDPLSNTTAVYEEAGLLVLLVDDGSLIHFAVWPDADQPVQLTRLDGGRWVHGPKVATMADVGQAIERGLV